MLSNHAFDSVKNCKRFLLDTDILQEAVADVGEGAPGKHAPSQPNFVNVMQFFGMNPQNNRFAPLHLGLVPC